MRQRAVVLGGGFAGALAALVLSDYADVTIVERDRLPDGPDPRKGTPQARHTHVLMSAGARALEKIIPNAIDELVKAGARRLGMPDQLLICNPQGWEHRHYDEMQFVMGCSRPFLDWFIRKHWPDTVTVVENTDVVGLAGTAARVTGAVVRDRATKQEATIDADIVIDATGRSSRATQWLAALGLPQATEEVIDPGIVYSTRVYEVPPGMEQWPGISVQPDPNGTPAGAGGVLLPVEDGKWIVTVAGFRGSEPPTTVEGYEAYARSLRSPILADVIARATPLTNPMGHVTAGNVRRRFERLPQWPQGLAVIGDAHCSFNPLYGQGLTVAITTAVVLRTGLANGASWQAIQRQIAKASDQAWMMASSQDVLYERTTGGNARDRWMGKAFQRYLNLLISAGDPVCSQALFDVYTMSATPDRIMQPRVLLAALRSLGRRRRLNTTAPITEAEERLLHPIDR